MVAKTAAFEKAIKESRKLKAKPTQDELLEVRVFFRFLANSFFISIRPTPPSPPNPEAFQKKPRFGFCDDDIFFTLMAFLFLIYAAHYLRGRKLKVLIRWFFLFFFLL